jgi:hypothetical protein
MSYRNDLDALAARYELTRPDRMHRAVVDVPPPVDEAAIKLGTDRSFEDEPPPAPEPEPEPAPPERVHATMGVIRIDTNIFE